MDRNIVDWLLLKIELELRQEALAINMADRISGNQMTRLTDKAKAASTIVRHAFSTFEQKLDKIIAQKNGLDLKIHSACAPHERAIEELKGEIQLMEDAAAIMSNGGPPLEGSGS